MTGKELKAWALTIHDESVIQQDKGYTYPNWEALPAIKLRAFYESTSSPTEATTEEIQP